MKAFLKQVHLGEETRGKDRLRAKSKKWTTDVSHTSPQDKREQDNILEGHGEASPGKSGGQVWGSGEVQDSEDAYLEEDHTRDLLPPRKGQQEVQLFLPQVQYCEKYYLFFYYGRSLNTLKISPPHLLAKVGPEIDNIL